MKHFFGINYQFRIERFNITEYNYEDIGSGSSCLELNKCMDVVITIVRLQMVNGVICTNVTEIIRNEHYELVFTKDK